MHPWPKDPRETPSFSMGLFADRVNRILEAPLPDCLRRGGGLDGGRQRAAIVPPADGGRPVHEALLAKGRLAAERREAMRLRAIERELRHLRPAPGITHAEAKKTPRRAQRIEDRLLQRGREAEERRLSEARRHEEQLLKETSIIAPFRPTISRRGQRATSKARKMAEETHKKWHEEREQRREAARTAKLLQDLSEMQDAPVINSRSERLAARRREKEGLLGISTADVLIERERIAQLKRWEKHEMGRQIEQTPQITLYAATLQREGDAAERLYTESYEKAEQRLRRPQNVMEPGVAPFTPRISPRAATKRRVCKVEDELMQKHMQSMVQREEARRKEEEQELRRHQPVINPVSEAIAARLPETSFERLCRHSVHTPRSKTSLTVDSFFQGSCNSDHKNGSTSGADGRHRRCRVSSFRESMAGTLQSYEECRQAKLRKLREEQDRLQREKCTFAPVTNSGNCIAGGMENVLARNQQWLARREKKLRELRQKGEAEKVKECTFRPERETSMINSLCGESIYGGDGMPWGVQEYLERQEEARRLKKESEARLQRRPSSAPRSLRKTTPREFVLGRRGSVPIRSLRRPSPAPLMSPEKDIAPLAPPQQSPQRQEDDLSMYERIYNRVYNTVIVSGNGDKA